MLHRIRRKPGLLRLALSTLAVALLPSGIPIAAAQTGSGASSVSIDTEPVTWKDRARLAVDGDGLAGAFGADALYLVEILPGVGQPSFVAHEAGGGAFWTGFYPLSAVKLIAAVAALEWVAGLGFTGDARVRFDDGFEATLAELYEQAITVSANWGYDRTLQIAGLDYVNQDFLARFALDATWLGASYSGLNLQNPPGYRLTEQVPVGGEQGATEWRSEDVPGRTAQTDYEGWNDSDLFDLVDVLRRVMLDTELPEGERFDIPPVDAERLRDALCRATPPLLEPGITEALGDDALVCNKTGVWPDGTCVDHAYIADTDTGRRFLLAAVAPCNWPLFASIGARAMNAVDGLSGTPIQEDAGRPISVLASDLGSSLRIGLDTEADWALLWIGDRPPVILAGPVLEATLDWPEAGSHLLVALTVEDGTPVGYRSVRMEIRPPG